MFLLICDCAQAVSIIPVSKDKWTCYDYSMNFTAENPEWGCLTISNNQWFDSNCGTSHMVNYQVINSTTLRIHDGLYNADYYLAGWQLENYYHFWINEKPIRRYTVLQDNRKLVC